MFSNLFLLKSVTQISTRRRPKSTRSNQLNRQHGLQLESLEDRMMLTTTLPTEIGKLFANDADRADQFGWKVDMTNDGKVAVIGATKDDASTRNAGAAYVFFNAGENDWSQVAKLTGPPVSVGRNDEFGEYVSITGGSSTKAMIRMGWPHWGHGKGRHS